MVISCKFNLLLINIDESLFSKWINLFVEINNVEVSLCFMNNKVFSSTCVLRSVFLATHLFAVFVFVFTFMSDSV